MSQAVETQQGRPPFWSLVREALAGSERDFTEGSLTTAIILLSVPMILEMFMESIFAVVDVFYVSRLGAGAIAVVGLTESLMVLIYAVAMGLGIGATATVARRIGENDRDGAAQTATHALYLGLAVSILLGLVGAVFAPDFLRLMGAEENVISEGTNFTRIMLGGNASVMFLFLINAIFRGAGDAAIAMRVLWLANILNIILAPLFIFGFSFFPELGVTGAAVGTTLGRGLGALYALFRLLSPGGRFDIRLEHWRLAPEMLWQLVKLSSSAMLQTVIGMASWIGLVRIVSGFGSDALAGYTIAIRVIVFALLPAFGMSNAAATLVGQSLGAGKPERAEQAVWRAGFYSAVFLTVIGVLFVAFAPQIIGIFAEENIVNPEVNSIGSNGLRIVALGFFFYGYGMVLEQAFNGAGDTWTPTVINLFIFWLFEIPLAYVLAYTFNLGVWGVFWAITIAFSMLAIVSGLLFRGGSWKKRKL